MFGHEDVFKTVYGASPNIAAAQSLLTQAGYSTTSKLSLTLGSPPSHYGDPEIYVAQALRRAWEATGMMTVTINEQEWAQSKASRTAGAFDVFLLGWFPDYFDSDDYVFPFLHWASGGSAQFGDWYHNNSMDLKIEAQAAEANPTTRAQILGEIQAAPPARVPALPLGQTHQKVGVKPTVSRIVLD